MIILSIFIICLYFYIKKSTWQTKWISNKHRNKIIILGHREVHQFMKEKIQFHHLKKQ